MYWSIKQFYSPDFFRVKLYGPYQRTEFRELLDEMLMDKEWEPGCAVLFDDLESSVGEMSEAELQTASDALVQNSRLFLHGKIALLFDKTSDFDAGVRFAENTQPIFPAMIEVFRNEKATFEWLADDTF